MEFKVKIQDKPYYVGADDTWGDWLQKNNLKNQTILKRGEGNTIEVVADYSSRAREVLESNERYLLWPQRSSSTANKLMPQKKVEPAHETHSLCLNLKEEEKLAINSDLALLFDEAIRRKDLDLLQKLPHNFFQVQLEGGLYPLTRIVGTQWEAGAEHVLANVLTQEERFTQLLFRTESSLRTIDWPSTSKFKQRLSQFLFRDDTKGLRFALFIANYSYPDDDLDDPTETVKKLAEALCLGSSPAYLGMPDPNACFFNTLEDGIWIRECYEDRDYINDLKNPRFNLSVRQMKEEIDLFLALLQKYPDAVGLIYFTGHGFSENHVQYLTPIDFDKDEVKDTCISLEDLKKSMSADRRGIPNILFLDCCRTQGNYDDTDSEIDAREEADMSDDLVEGIFTAFATAPARASFGLDFTQTLLECLSVPVELEVLLRVVRIAMKKKERKTIPWVENNLYSAFHFCPMADRHY